MEYTNDYWQNLKILTDNIGFQNKERAYNLLDSVIFLETAGTRKTNAKNPKSSATGLIQFMSATAQELGTSTAALAQMNYQQQFPYVEKYLKMKNILAYENGSDVDFYLTVLYPAARSKSLSYSFSPSVSAANSGLDLNKNGTVTKSEVAQFFQTKIEQSAKSRQPYNGGSSSSMPTFLNVTLPREKNFVVIFFLFLVIIGGFTFFYMKNGK